MRWVERSSANNVVLGEQHGSDGNEKSELKHAGDEGAVDRANSKPVPPSANEHSDGIESNNGVCDAHEDGDCGELRALGEAVDVTVLIKLNFLLQEIPV